LNARNVSISGKPSHEHLRFWVFSVLRENEIVEMIVNQQFVELPLCPFCGELTDLRGEFLPCCGEESRKVYDLLNKGKPIKWVRLIPKEIREST